MHRGRPRFKKRPQEEDAENIRVKMPNRKVLEQFAVVTKMLGVFNIRTMGEDGEERVTRIPGKLKKRVWFREGDLVMIRLWDFQPSKADVVWVYKGAQVEHLRKRGLLDNLPV